VRTLGAEPALAVRTKDIREDIQMAKIHGTYFDDHLIGTKSGDDIEGRRGDDAIWGYGGNDDIEGNRGNDKLYGGNGNDHLEGNEGNDKLYGGSGNDELEGGSGNDKLFGGAGDDDIEGGSGKDVLDGGRGRNELEGGLGADTFIFRFGITKIDDFNPGKDVIWIDDALGADTFKELKAFATVDGEDLVFDFGRHELRLDDTKLSDLRASDFDFF
jgi:Ca2+-binding RTX toxin-like protein